MYQSTHLAVAVAGVVAVLPGAVAPDEFAFVGLAQGLGGGVVVGGAHGSGGGPGSPLGRVVGCRRWTGTAIRGRSGAPAPPGPRPRVPCAPGSRVPGRCPRCRCPVRALVAQPTIRRENRSMTNAVQRVPRPGRHVGAGRPPICGSGRWRRESRRSRPVGARSPSAGPVARTVLPGPAPVSPSARMRRSTVHRATPGPSCRVLSSRQVFLDPSVALNGSALRARILPPPRRRRTPTSSRAGGTGRRNRWTGRSCTLTRSGRCRSARPRTPPSGPRCRRRSARWALTLCHRQNSRRAPQDRVGPPPSSRTSFSNSLMRRAPSVVVPGRSPASIRAWRTQPRRVSGLTPSSSPTRLKHPLDRSGSARAPQAPAGSHVA